MDSKLFIQAIVKYLVGLVLFVPILLVETFLAIKHPELRKKTSQFQRGTIRTEACFSRG